MDDPPRRAPTRLVETVDRRAPPRRPPSLLEVAAEEVVGVERLLCPAVALRAPLHRARPAASPLLRPEVSAPRRPFEVVVRETLLAVGPLLALLVGRLPVLVGVSVGAVGALRPALDEVWLPALWGAPPAGTGLGLAAALA